MRYGRTPRAQAGPLHPARVNSKNASIREKTELIEQKNRESAALLLNIPPGEIDEMSNGLFSRSDELAHELGSERNVLMRWQRSKY